MRINLQLRCGIAPSDLLISPPPLIQRQLMRLAFYSSCCWGGMAASISFLSPLQPPTPSTGPHHARKHTHSGDRGSLGSAYAVKAPLDGMLSPSRAN
jgi:hypothetical protein